MQMVFDVASRTETLHLDGDLHFVLQGQLKFVPDLGDEHVMGQISFPVPESLFDKCPPSTLIVFEYTDKVDYYGD